MSIDFDLFCLMVSFQMPKAVELYVRSVVAGWRDPIQFNEGDYDWRSTLGALKARSFF
jgi:hypothetical protein